VLCDAEPRSPIEVVDRLRVHIAGHSRNDWVFVSATGAPLDPDNLANRVLAPACEEAAVEWVGFHTFRHFASRLFAEGRNILQVQRWLGHHSPSFTLDTYVHLLDKDLGRPLEPLWVKEKPRQGPENAASAIVAASARMVN
jgi:integrase